MLFLEHAMTSLFHVKAVAQNVNSEEDDHEPDGGHSHSSSHGHSHGSSHGHSHGSEHGHSHGHAHESSHVPSRETSIDAPYQDNAAGVLITDAAVPSEANAGMALTKRKSHDENSPLLRTNSQGSNISTSHAHDGTQHHHDHVHVPISLVSTSALPNRKAVIVAHILELGIVMHSILIGLTLGTTTSAHALHPLLIAICFHQFFEGVGLGGAIAIARVSKLKAYFFSTLFSITAPTGMILCSHTL
jgi:zinc transporter ZupT